MHAADNSPQYKATTPAPETRLTPSPYALAVIEPIRCYARPVPIQLPTWHGEIIARDEWIGIVRETGYDPSTGLQCMRRIVVSNGRDILLVPPEFFKHFHDLHCECGFAIFDDEKAARVLRLLDPLPPLV